MSQTVSRTSWTNQNIHIFVSKSQPRLNINNDLTIDIYPAFKLDGCWPKSGKKQFLYQLGGKPNTASLRIDIVSKETGSTKPYSTDRDTWHLDLLRMENQVLALKNREICFEVIKRIIIMRLSAKSPVFNPAVVRTIFLYICEKHSDDKSWTREKLPDRINSFLLQLVASVQNRCIPHFYLSNLNLLQTQSTKEMRVALQEAWKLAREFCINSQFFEESFDFND